MQVRAASDRTGYYGERQPGDRTYGSIGDLSSRTPGRTPRQPLTSRDNLRRPTPKEINNRPPGIAAAAAAYAQQTPGPRRSLSARPSTAASHGSKRMSVGMDPLAPFGYQTMSPIAQGAFSQVARARHLSTQREVAVKTFNKAKIGKEPHLVQAMKNELDVLKQLQPASHPHIANIVELLDTKASLHAILEYCSGGSLQRKLAGRPHATGLPEREAGAVAAQVGAALMHMHDRGIAHRDIKPENILYVDPTCAAVKLCDFGFAVACGTRRVKTVCGSPQYMAPELSRREPYTAWAVDMWAYGCLVFEMLEGKPAFRGSSMEQLTIRIVRASHEAFTSATPPAARPLIKDCIVVDVAQRRPARVVLQHPCAQSSAQSFLERGDVGGMLAAAFGHKPYEPPAPDPPPISAPRGMPPSAPTGRADHEEVEEGRNECQQQ